MKNISALVMLLIVVNGLFAQSYTPFPTMNAQWITKRYNAGNGGTPSTNYYVYTMQGDTLINDTTYHKIYFLQAQSPQYSALSAGIRELDHRVYIRPMGSGEGWNTCVNAPDQEYLIYDFTIDEVGDSLYLPTQDGMSLYVTQTIDSILVNEEYRTRWSLIPFETSCSPMSYTYIEGIGSDRHPFGHIVWMTWEISYSLSCMTREGQFEYSAYDDPPLCDIEDFVDVQNENALEPKIFMSGSKLVFDPGYDWRGAEFEIYSMSGQRVASWSHSKFQADFSDWSAGIYLVRVQMANGTLIRKKVMR